MILKDYLGRDVRLTDERLQHILDAFVVTAYFTDKIKKGVQLWPSP